LASHGPIANFAVHQAGEHATLIPLSSVICGGASFASASWSISDGRVLPSSNLDETQTICLHSQGIYTIQYNIIDSNGVEDSLLRRAIREASGDNGLIARYPLSTTSFLADISPKRHPVATLEGPQSSTSVYEGCEFNSYIDLSFDDSIALPEVVRNSINEKPGFTAALWAKPEGPGQLLYKHVTVGIWIESSTEIQFAVGTNANETHNAWFDERAATATVDDNFDGDWHHYAVSFDGINVRGYIDGFLEVTKAVPSAYAAGEVRSGNWEMAIGHRIWKGRNLVGGVKDFRLYERELSEQEILSLTEDTHNCEAQLECDDILVLE